MNMFNNKNILDLILAINLISINFTYLSLNEFNFARRTSELETLTKKMIIITY